MTSVLVTGAGGFIGGHLVARLREQGVEQHPWRGPGAAGRVAPALRRCRQPVCGPAGAGGVPERLRGRRHRLQPRRRHGRHGLHREQQGAVHALGADLHAHARGGRARAGVRRFFYSSSACVYAAGKQGSPEVSRCGRPTPTRPCPRTATAGRSCSASACAATTARTSASRPASPATTTSTVRTAPRTAAGRRPRPPSAARWPRPSSAARARSRSGETASRRAASRTSTTAWTARCA